MLRTPCTEVNADEPLAQDASDYACSKPTGQGNSTVNWHCMRSAKASVVGFPCWYPMQERRLAMAEVRCNARKPMLAMNSCGISSRSLSWVQSCECRSHQCCVKQWRVGTGRDGRWRTFMGWCGLCSVSGAIAMHGECSLQLSRGVAVLGVELACGERQKADTGIGFKCNVRVLGEMSAVL